MRAPLDFKVAQSIQNFTQLSALVFSNGDAFHFSYVVYKSFTYKMIFVSKNRDIIIVHTAWSVVLGFKWECSTVAIL